MITYVIVVCLYSRLHPSNCLGIRSFADTLMCTDLVLSTNKYIEKHFVEVSNAEEFLRLDSSEMSEIIARDELYVTNEEQVTEKSAHSNGQLLIETYELLHFLLLIY